MSPWATVMQHSVHICMATILCERRHNRENEKGSPFVIYFRREAYNLKGRREDMVSPFYIKGGIKYPHQALRKQYTELSIQ